MRHPYGETIGVRPFIEGGKDSHNNPIQAWGEAVDYPGCAVAPAQSSEADRGESTTSFTVYGPYDLEASPKDLVVYRGLEFNIDGQPEFWANPFDGSRPGCVLTIRRTDG